MAIITHATVFTTALCNLNCAYCYICKDTNGNLKQIDNDIAKDFEEDKYIKQILAYGNDISNTLDAITLWGGEPFLHAERFYSRLDKWFQAFPNLMKLDTSTNFTIPNQYKIIEHLLQEIDRQPFKGVFQVDLQISIDGYEEMNEFSRGPGVTKRFLENFRGLCNITYNKERIHLYVHTKPTLAKSTFHYLDSVEKCERWFEFFDKEMYQPYLDANQPFQLGLCLYNCAAPTEWTKEDGIEFAQIMRNMQQVDRSKYKAWKYHDTGVPIAGAMAHLAAANKTIHYGQKRCGGSCGSFSSSIVPIPHDRYTMCHRGLFDAYVDYCNNVSQRDELNGLSSAYFNPRNSQEWIYTLEEFTKMSNVMRDVIECPSQFIYSDWVINIREFAKAGVIDKKWEDINLINQIMPYFMENSYCMQDAFIFTGSWITMPSLELPLLFNGAMDVALEEVERIKREREEL